MSCCNEVINLGCIDYCSAFDTGYTATQTGTHTMKVYLGNSVVQTIDLGTLTATVDNIIVPASSLNESKPNDIQVENPDGSLYEFSTDIYCIRLYSQYYTSLGDVIT